MEGTITRRKNMKSNKFTTSQLTILGLMAGILFLMAYTPLGYLNIGPLAVTFNVIPVAICAVVLGPTGGAVAGAVFGLTVSYRQWESAVPAHWEQHCFRSIHS